MRSAAGRHARGQVIEALVGEPGHLGVEQRQVDELALAGSLAVMQGGQDGAAGVHAGHEIGDCDADLHGLAAGLAGHAHDPAHALDQKVVARPLGEGAGLAEPGDRTIDQAGVLAGQVVVGEPVLLQAAGLEVLDQHVAMADQPPGQGGALRLGDIQAERALVAVRREEIGAFAGLLAVWAGQERRAPAAGIVAGAGPLDLDHVGAQVAQQLGAAGSRQDAGEIEDPQAVKRAGHDASDKFVWNQGLGLVAQGGGQVKRASRRFA